MDSSQTKDFQPTERSSWIHRVLHHNVQKQRRLCRRPVRTNVGMSSQTIFISTLSLILNSDKDPRSHKDFISSDDLFSELLIDHLVWTHCVKVKHTHGCSPRQSCDHIGHQSKDWTARDVNQNSVRTYQVNTSSTETNRFTQVWTLIWYTKDNVQNCKPNKYYIPNV